MYSDYLKLTIYYNLTAPDKKKGIIFFRFHNFKKKLKKH